MIVKVNYTAIKMDNYHGGSGMPFKGYFLTEFLDRDSILKVFTDSKQKLDRWNEKKEDFCQHYSLSNVEIPEQNY